MSNQYDCDTIDIMSIFIPSRSKFGQSRCTWLMYSVIPNWSLSLHLMCKLFTTIYFASQIWSCICFNNFRSNFWSTHRSHIHIEDVEVGVTFCSVSPWFYSKCNDFFCSHIEKTFLYNISKNQKIYFAATFFTLRNVRNHEQHHHSNVYNNLCIRCRMMKFSDLTQFFMCCPTI